MKTSKKLICFLCCLVVIFTCATISWQPEAEAAAPAAAYVAGLVGSFILSAGFEFATIGDFQSATDAFLESDVARGITEITDYVGKICALGNVSEPLLLAELIQTDFFKQFWNSIFDFFGNGDITIDLGSIPAPREGYINLNGLEILKPPINFSTTTYSYFALFENNGTYYFLCNSDVIFKSGSYGSIYSYSKCQNVFYELSNDKWSQKISSNSGQFQTVYNLLWANHDVMVYHVDNPYLYLAGTPLITEGQENIVVIPVTNSSSHSAEDIIASWARAGENGTAIDWQLDSIPAYGAITSTNTADPLTLTQTGVLTQSGVNVQTKEEVKEEIKQEAIKELNNYENNEHCKICRRKRLRNRPF